MNNLSLNKKVILVSVIVTFIISSIIGLLLYNSQVKPVKTNVEQQLIRNMQVFIDSKIDLKIQAGIVGATMLSLDEQTQNAVITGDTSQTDALFKGLKKNYADKTNFQGIFSELIQADGQSLSRSWKLGQKGDNRLNDPLIKQVFDSKKAIGALGFRERGVTVTSVSPIFENKTFLGAATMIQGVGSISRDYSNEFATQNGTWIMLVDKEYVANKFGTTKTVDELKPITNRYVIANNKWFADEVINATKEVYQPVDGDKKMAYLANERFVVDIPAYDEEGNVFGRQIFIQDESVYTQPLLAAVNQAWETLAKSIVGIIILTVILLLVISRIVIQPLAKLKDTITQIEKTGDFALRTQIDQNDEVGQTAHAINQHLERVNQAINEANSVIGALANGDLGKRMQQHYNGSLLELKNGVNQSSLNVAEMLSQISGVMAQLKEGQFHVDIKHQAK